MAEVLPPELALLLDIGERPRAGGWSLRAALTRFGQPRAQVASELTEVLRRLEGALKPSAGLVEREGPAVWAAFTDGAAGEDAHAHLVVLLGVAADLDTVADDLAEWAADITRERPDAAVEAAAADLTARLDALGVPREARPPPSTRRRGV